MRPGFFSVLGLPIVSGRAFTDSEVASAGSADLRPAIVTETTARNLWPAGDAVGRTLLREEMTFENETVVRRDVTLQVVGVVADAQLTSLGRVDPYYVYEPGGSSALFVKSRGDFAATAASIGAVVRGLDPSLALRVLPLEANIGWWRGVSGTVTTLAAALGALALVLSAVGIYGVVAYSVTRRYREIGIRIALGARVPDVVGMILRQALRPVVVGGIVGLVAAIAVLTRVVARPIRREPGGRRRFRRRSVAGARRRARGRRARRAARDADGSDRGVALRVVTGTASSISARPRWPRGSCPRSAGVYRLAGRVERRGRRRRNPSGCSGRCPATAPHCLGP